MASLTDATKQLSIAGDASKDDPLPIVRPNDAGFGEAVWGRVFNHRRDTTRTPRAVVRAANAAHVRGAVELARREGCRVSVRSGGHSWAAWSVRQDAVLIDLEGMKGGGSDGLGGVSYDEGTKIVSCPPSTVGGDLNRFLIEKGRLFAGGHCPDVGLGGFLLQGGIGWNCKNWGWACEYIIGIDVVTADAKELHCSAVENADLFWAARGSGPGFPAVVTRFYLLTRPYPEMYNSTYVYPQSMYRTVFQWVIDTCPTADPGHEIVCVSRKAPDGNGVEIVAGFTTFQPDKQHAERALQPIHDSRPPNAIVEVFCDPTSLLREYSSQDEAYPHAYRYCSENAWVANDADVPAVLEKAFTTLPSQKTFALYCSLNPTSRRPGPDMALSMQSDHYFALYTAWEDAADDARCTAWTHEVMRDIERHSVGSYLGDADFQHRQTRFWSKEAGQRLAGIRRKWDPEGRICGYLDAGDKSGVDGLKNEFEWKETDIAHRL